MQHLTAKRLHQMKQEKEFADVNWHMLNEYLPEKLIKEMDEERQTDYHKGLSTALDFYTLNRQPSSSSRETTRDIELTTVQSIHEQQYISKREVFDQPGASSEYFVLPLFDSSECIDNEQNQNMRNELILRCLTALAANYEKQWHLGMIRRRTLYILTRSIDSAKHQHSLKRHWTLVAENFRLSRPLRHLVRFKYAKWINTQLDKLLFDHVFLTIELATGE